MKREQSVCVVIPVYKESISLNERRSLRQCIKVLVSYEIILVCPTGLNLTNYLYEKPDIKIEYFDRCYFENINTYNKLLLSKTFYKRFDIFKFVLIYQLDAWIFRDELDYWCNLGYDYIGAPWVEVNVFNWLKLSSYPKHLYYIHRLLGNGRLLKKVGNGGFSLRKVKAFRINIRIFQKTALRWKANEDSFFSHYVKTFNPFFKVAPLGKALEFSFDIHPEQAFKLNNYNLPFGCHAWNREESPYNENLSFWGSKIKANGLP